MPINNITQTISTLPPAGRRGIDVQTVFVIKQEDFQDHLQGITVTELNTLKDQLNSRIGEINSTTTTMSGYADTTSAGASTATTKAGEASTSAGEALAYRNQAETYKNNASASSLTASTSATKASQWADNNYNVEVEAGKYSAKHWATEASNILASKVSLNGYNITVNVGAGQTYTTINQALEYLSGFYPLYKTTGVTATINLKAGFVMNEQVLVRGLNLGWITIVGEDAETIITHTALTTDFTTADYGFASYPAFGVSKGGTSPVIGQLFRFNVEKAGGNKHGIVTYGAGSSANVLMDKGFIGAGSAGIYASTGSTINAQRAVIQNQTTGAVRVGVQDGSHIEASNINTTGGTVTALNQTANTLTSNGIIYQ